MTGRSAENEAPMTDGACGVTTGPQRTTSDVGRVLAAAFRDEPVMAWLTPDGQSRAEILPVFFTWLAVEVFLNDGRVDTLTADGTLGGELLGVALWLDRFGSGYRMVGSGADPSGVLGELGADPDRMAVLMRAMDQAHPDVDHEYLFFTGVRPQRQGQGLGSRLLRRAHERLDVDGIGAYLEATSPASRAFYARHGYRDHGDPIRLPDGPLLWPMLRTSEAPRACPSTGPPTTDAQPGTDRASDLASSGGTTSWAS